MSAGKELTGIVLAGGKSSRMGRDKASLPWEGSDLLHTVLKKLALVCAQLVVVSNISREIFSPDTMIVADNYQECGPLGGIQAGIAASRSEYNFVVACDMPYINVAAVNYLADVAQGYDLAVPFSGGHYHPLYAVYHRRCLAEIDAMLIQGQYKVTSLYPRLNLRTVTEPEMRQFDPTLAMFSNFNTPIDLSISCN